MLRALPLASAYVRERISRAGKALKPVAAIDVINNKKRFDGLAVKNLAKLHHLQGR
jgi:hypothetical protein